MEKMGKNYKLSYIYRKEAEQFSFYVMPKIVFHGDDFCTMPLEAKVLYCFMLDRMSLSIENKWFDAQGRAYIRFSTDAIREQLYVGRNKALDTVKVLEEYGLIERRKPGQGKTSIIYVMKFEKVEETEDCPAERESYDELNTSDESLSGNMVKTNDEVLPEKVCPDNGYFRMDDLTECETASESSQNVNDVHMKFNQETSGEAMTDKSQVNNLTGNLMFANETSEIPESGSSEVWNEDPNETKFNNNNINYNTSISILSDQESDDDVYQSRKKEFNLLALYNRVRTNMGYDDLCISHPYDHSLINGIVDIVCETVSTISDTITVARQKFPAEVVKSRLLKLNYLHIDYVLSCFKNNASHVYNIKSYMLTSLFNASATIDAYYMAAVNHNMAIQTEG